MPEFTYDLDPVTRITTHAVGEPGQRVFYIQARRDRQLITLIAEKEQVRALAQAINQLLDDLTEKNPLLSSGDDIVLVSDMSLEEPLESSFRIAQMGLGYDVDRDMVVLVMQGLQEDESEVGADGALQRHAPADAGVERARRPGGRPGPQDLRELRAADGPDRALLPPDELAGTEDRGWKVVLEGRPPQTPPFQNFNL